MSNNDTVMFFYIKFVSIITRKKIFYRREYNDRVKPQAGINETKHVVTTTPTCFVQCCTLVVRGNRNAPERIPKAAGLCFITDEPCFGSLKVERMR